MSSRRALAALATASVLIGCGAKPAAHSATHDSAPPAASASSARRADSLALTVRPGVEVWFTDSRDATDSAGTPCIERVLEIREAGRRTPVPLLYTGETPRLVNDSAIEAAIWLHCRPSANGRGRNCIGFPRTRS